MKLDSCNKICRRFESDGVEVDTSYSDEGSNMDRSDYYHRLVFTIQIELSYLHSYIQQSIGMNTISFDFHLKVEKIK